jgi:MFS family permease
VFLCGQAVSLLGDGLAVLTVPLLTLQLTDDPLLAAIAAAPRYVAYVVVGLPAGVLVERWNPRTVMLITDGARAGVFIFLGALAGTGRLPAYGPAALAVVAATASVFFETALNVTIRDIADEQGEDGPATTLLVRASAYLELAAQGAILMGPALAGVLASTVGIEAALLVNAATFVFSGLTLLGIRLPATARPARRSIRAELMVGLRYLLHEPLIRLVTALQAVANILVAVESLVIFTAHEVLGLDPLAVSVVVAASGLGGVLGAVLAHRLVEAFGEARVFVTCLAGMGAALAAIGVTHSVAWLAAANLLIGGSATAAVIAVRVLRLRVVPRVYLARVTASTKVIALAPQPLGVVAAGILTGVLGGDPRPVFLSAGVLAILLAGVTARQLAAAAGGQSDVRPAGGLNA